MPKKDGSPTAAELRKAERDELVPYEGGIDYYSRPDCKHFEPFEQDVAVCKNCGALADDHSVKYRPYDQAVTRWFVRNAGVTSRWGGGPSVHGRDLLLDRKHLLNDCGIDYERTGMLEIQTDYVFNGTDCDSLAVHMLGAKIYCNCGEYEFKSCGGSYYKPKYLELRLPEGFTMGQVMWQVIREGEIT